MIRYLFVAVALAASALLFSASHAGAQFNGARGGSDGVNTLELVLGEQKVISAAGVKTYSEGVKGIVDIRLTSDASRFVVIGLKPGVTTLLLIMVDGGERVVTITVTDPNAPTAPPPDKAAIVVNAQPSVRLDLYFVQVSRNNSLNFGITPGQGDGYALGNFALAYSIPAAALISKTAVVGTNFLPTLNMAQTRGWAKIRRHVALITTNGTQASFDSGGDFNVISSQALTPTLVSVKFGTTLNVQPRYDAESGRVELIVSAQVADLTPSGGGVPGRTRSNVETVANLALGESLAVAGLIAQNEQKSRGGIPFLSQIPILGLLFGEVSKDETESENVVFISPSVVEPLKHARAKEFLSNALREYDAFSGSPDSARVFPGNRWAVPNGRAPLKD